MLLHSIIGHQANTTFMESVKQMIQDAWEATKEMVISTWEAMLEMATTSLEYLASFLHQDSIAEDTDTELSDQEDPPGLYIDQTPGEE